MRILIIFFALFTSFSAFGQDVIYCHSGKQLRVKVAQVGENSISYLFSGESVVNTIGRAAVSRIQFESGRIEEISETISISGNDGWENVIITNNPNEIVGLKRLGEIKAKAGGYWSLRSTKGSDRKSTERIKREAAELGGHVVYLQQHETKGRALYSNPESFQSGVAYGY
jgi:hypothetical protein